MLVFHLNQCISLSLVKKAFTNALFKSFTMQTAGCIYLTIHLSFFRVHIHIAIVIIAFLNVVIVIIAFLNLLARAKVDEEDEQREAAAHRDLHHGARQLIGGRAPPRGLAREREGSCAGLN